MAHVDVKVTIWQRLVFSDDADMEKITQMIQENAGVNGVCEEGLGFTHMQWMDETEAVVHVTDNDGVSTIEVYDSYNDQKPIWQNGRPAI